MPFHTNVWRVKKANINAKNLISFFISVKTHSHNHVTHKTAKIITFLCLRRLCAAHSPCPVVCPVVPMYVPCQNKTSSDTKQQKSRHPRAPVHVHGYHSFAVFSSKIKFNDIIPEPLLIYFENFTAIAITVFR